MKWNPVEAISNAFNEFAYHSVDLVTAGKLDNQVELGIDMAKAKLGDVLENPQALEAAKMYLDELAIDFVQNHIVMTPLEDQTAEGYSRRAAEVFLNEWGDVKDALLEKGIDLNEFGADAVQDLINGLSEISKPIEIEASATVTVGAPSGP